MFFLKPYENAEVPDASLSTLLARESVNDNDDVFYFSSLLFIRVR